MRAPSSLIKPSFPFLFFFWGGRLDPRPKRRPLPPGRGIERASATGDIYVYKFNDFLLCASAVLELVVVVVAAADTVSYGEIFD